MMIAQKMIEDPREKELQNNQEGETSEAKHKMRGIRQWSSMNNPRIVRVSRAFGGKDRHSKVSTIRGLRDRRVRLSVPTAIQLYDLQDKLNLNQPSKVVDWLIDAAQHEIDKLPPLPLIPPSYIQFPQAMASSSATDHAVNDEGISNTANPMLSPSFAEDTELFPKFRGTTKDIDAMPYTSYQQMEPSNSYTSVVAENSSQEFHLPSELSSRFLMPGTQFMLPTMSSPYVHSPNHFQHPSTFAQLLQSNSLGINTNMYSSTNFRQYISHQEQHHEAQHEDSMRERSSHEVASPIYKNSGAADGSNTASFL